MDHQIIRELYKNTIAAAQVLGVDADFQTLLAKQAKEIAPNTIGRYGQLQEWLQDKDDTANKHRHVSHLWGVYPGTDIVWKDTSMMKAARQSLIYRGMMVQDGVWHGKPIFGLGSETETMRS